MSKVWRIRPGFVLLGALNLFYQIAKENVKKKMFVLLARLL